MVRRTVEIIPTNITVLPQLKLLLLCPQLQYRPEVVNSVTCPVYRTTSVFYADNFVMDALIVGICLMKAIAVSTQQI